MYLCVIIMNKIAFQWSSISALQQQEVSHGVFQCKTSNWSLLLKDISWSINIWYCCISKDAFTLKKGYPRAPNCPPSPFLNSIPNLVVFFSFPDVLSQCIVERRPRACSVICSSAPRSWCDMGYDLLLFLKASSY